MICMNRLLGEGAMNDARFLTDEQLRHLLQLARKATPTPWYVRHLDDSDAMNLVAISTTQDSGKVERFPHFNAKELIAATLVQAPRYVDIADEEWDENAAFIAAAANAIPLLVEELLALRKTKFMRLPTPTQNGGGMG